MTKFLEKLIAFITVKKVVGLLALLVVIVTLGLVLYLQDKNIPVLNPQGIIADKQLSLLVFTTILGLFVIIPVFIMMFAFAWKYRENSKKKPKYTPDVGGNKMFELLWWGIPFVIIIILSIVTWFSTHDLDPYKPLRSSTKPITIQVVALQWRWLFIYPEQNIATINEVRFPEKTPINFEISGDAPMSAFWIPSLGSQTYAMNGMTSQLKLEANGVGEYIGMNTNINGEGYADMRFKAISLRSSDFIDWANNVRMTEPGLNWNKYEAIQPQTRDTSVYRYSLIDHDIFDRILMKYMDHGGSSHSGHTSSSEHDSSHDMMSEMEGM